MRKLLSFVVVLVLSATVLMAQDKVVTGQVISSEDGEPIIGATIQLPGTTTGTITDVDGNFSLRVPQNASSVSVSYVGMETATVALTGKKLSITLSAANEVLDDVVVVAYGTQKKTTLTGAVQQIKSEQMEVRPVSSATSALEGTVSGVQVNSTYGAPGSSPSIRIRGTSTVNGSTSVLYVLDGVPFNGNISDLNPADIESISVLKDAASAALYGNRAGNGVILITTKKGKMGKVNVNLDIKQGTYSRGMKEYKRTNAKQWMETEFQNLKNHRMYTNGEDEATATAYAQANLINDIAYLNIFNKADDELFDENGKMVSDAEILSGYKDDLDWEDQATRNGHRQEYNLSANGAGEKADYLFSFGYLDENGYVYDSGFERYTGRATVNVNPTKWLKTGFNLNATHQNYENTNGDSDASYTNVFMYARSIAPIYPVHLHDVTTGEYLLDANGKKQYDPGYYTDENGNEIATRNQYSDRHVIWENELNFDKTVRNTFNGTAYATFNLPYNIKATINGNMSTRTSINSTYDNATIGDGKGSNGRAGRTEYNYKNYTFQQMLTWNKEFGLHNVDVLLDHENYYYNYSYLYGYKTDEIIAGWGNFSNFTTITDLDSYEDTYTTESYLARARYYYDDRYNAEFSFRRDGSSRFSEDSRWGNFWSVGANWVISSEAFMKDVKWVDFLKFRADYGEVASDMGASYYSYLSLYGVTQNANAGAIYLSQYGNTDLHWETAQSWGTALEGRLFNRANFTIEYFDKRNKDLLFDTYMPLSSGATSTSSAESVITQNMGTVSNRGVEFSFDVDVFRNRDWKVNVGANATMLKNEVTKLPAQYSEDGIIDGNKKIVEGKDRYSFYTYTWEGIDTYNGRSLYKFNDTDYSFTASDGTVYGSGSALSASNVSNYMVVIDGVPYTYSTTYAKKEFHGHATPDLYGSFNASVAWKDLTLSALFTYQLGGKVMDYTYQGLMSAGSSPSNFSSDIMNAWTTADATTEHTLDATGVPVVNYDLSNYNDATSSRWLTKANYLVLKNIALSYQLPKQWVNRIDLSSVGITASCENVFTKTARQGMNPQQSYNGNHYSYMVTPRVFTVGLSLKF